MLLGAVSVGAVSVDAVPRVSALLFSFKVLTDQHVMNMHACVFPQSLCQILEASMSTDRRILEAQIDGLMLTLYHQVRCCLTWGAGGSVPHT